MIFEYSSGCINAKRYVGASALWHSANWPLWPGDRKVSRAPNQATSGCS